MLPERNEVVKNTRFGGSVEENCRERKGFRRERER